MKVGMRVTALLVIAAAARVAVGQESTPQEAGAQQSNTQQPAALPASDEPVPGGQVYVPSSLVPFASVGAAYSDNLQHSSTNEQSGGGVDAAAGVHIRHNGSLSLNADIAGQYREFVGVNLPGQFLPSVNAVGTAVAIPEMLLFRVQDTLGQLSTQAIDALADTQRQDANFLTLGPEILVPFAGRNVFRADLTYGLTTYQHDNTTNTRYIADTGLGRSISELSAVSINYRYTSVDYEHSDLYPRVTNEVAYLRYTAQGSRTLLSIEAGREDVKVKAEGINNTAPYVILSLQRRLTPVMSLTAEYDHSTSDASESLRADAQNAFNTGNTLNVQVTAEPFTADRGYLMLIRTGPFGTLGLQGSVEKDKYRQNVLLDRTSPSADIVVDHRLTPEWTVTANVRWRQDKYTNTGIKDSALLTSLGLTRQISRSLRAELLVEHNRGTGLDTVTGLGAYKENRLALTLSYAPQAFASDFSDPVNQFRYQHQDQTHGQGLNPFAPR